jgi:hypothetical protein
MYSRLNKPESIGWMQLKASRGGHFKDALIMKKITLLLLVIATLAGVVVFTVTTSRHVTAQEPQPIFVR